MPRGGLAFYNCGPVSGASQPHKHVQIVPLPLDDSANSSSNNNNNKARPPIWPAVAAATAGASLGQPVELHSMPFVAFAATLAPQQGTEEVGAYLAGVYRQLVAQCTEFVERRTGRAGATPQGDSISFNMSESWQGSWVEATDWGAAGALLPTCRCSLCGLAFHRPLRRAVRIAIYRLSCMAQTSFCTRRPSSKRSLHRRVHACGAAAGRDGGPCFLQLSGLCRQHICAQPRGARLCAGARPTTRASCHWVSLVAW